MTATRAVYSWDVQIKKFKDMLFIDKRYEEGTETMLDMQTVSETALPDYTPIDDDTINGAKQLMKETAKIHMQLLQAVQEPKKFTKLDRADPHEEDEDQKMLRLGYRYKLYKFSQDCTVCIRSQNHFLTEGTNEGLCNMYPLLEWNQKRQAWTQDLDSFTMKCLTREMTDNASKFNRWTMQSLIAGVDKMRFAFVQRVNIESNKAHKVSGFISVMPEMFAKELNMNVQNCWAILWDLIQTVQRQDQPSAEYLFMKDATLPNYKLIHMIMT